MSSGNYSTHVNINNEAKVGDSLSVGESGEVVGEAGSDVEGKDRGHVKNDFADEGDWLDLPPIPGYEWAPHEPRT